LFSSKESAIMFLLFKIFEAKCTKVLSKIQITLPVHENPAHLF